MPILTFLHSVKNGATRALHTGDCGGQVIPDIYSQVHSCSSVGDH